MIQYLDFSNVYSSLSHTWSVSLFFILYLCFIFLSVYFKERVECHRYSAISMLIILLLMYFPPLVNFFTTRFFSSHEYSRIGWGLLVCPTIAYGITIVFFKPPSIMNRKLLVLTTIAFFIIISIKPQSYFKMPKNIYKLPPESLEVAQIINSSNATGTNIGYTFYVINDNVITPIELVFYGLVAYDGSYDYIYAYDASLIDSKYYDLLITDKNNDERFTNAGYHLVGETAHAHVYKK